MVNKLIVLVTCCIEWLKEENLMNKHMVLCVCTEKTGTLKLAQQRVKDSCLSNWT